MSDPNWTDPASVRAWLDAHYPNASQQTGSPFFQYLKDELAKGNKIEGRETHLSKSEFFRWLTDTLDGRACYYPMGSKRITYYPEYVADSSDPSSQSSIPDIALNGGGTSDVLSNRQSHPGGSQHTRTRPVSTLQTEQTMRKRTKTSRESTVAHDRSKRSLRTKAPPPRRRAKLATTQAKSKRLFEEALQQQKARVSTLRPRRAHQRGRTGRRGGFPH